MDVQGFVGSGVVREVEIVPPLGRVSRGRTLAGKSVHDLRLGDPVVPGKASFQQGFNPSRTGVRRWGRRFAVAAGLIGAVEAFGAVVFVNADM